MTDFNREHLDTFLAVVRKYMQLRGNISQKDLAELTGIGVSTISRFLNQKTQILDDQIIARIVAKLNIPIFEILDFIEEEYQIKFSRLVKFYREATETEKIGDDQDETQNNVLGNTASGTAKISAQAKVSIGNGPTRTIPFNPENNKNKIDLSISDKLQSLSPRQKAYLTNFLDLDIEGRDLVVDIGNSLFNYFKQKGLEF